MPIGLSPRHDGGRDIAAGPGPVLTTAGRQWTRRYGSTASAARVDQAAGAAMTSKRRVLFPPVGLAGLRPRDADEAASKQQRESTGEGASSLRRRRWAGRMVPSRCRRPLSMHGKRGILVAPGW